MYPGTELPAFSSKDSFIQGARKSSHSSRHQGQEEKDKAIERDLWHQGFKIDNQGTEQEMRQRIQNKGLQEEGEEEEGEREEEGDQQNDQEEKQREEQRETEARPESAHHQKGIIDEDWRQDKKQGSRRSGLKEKHWRLLEVMEDRRKEVAKVDRMTTTSKMPGDVRQVLPLDMTSSTFSSSLSLPSIDEINRQEVRRVTGDNKKQETDTDENKAMTNKCICETSIKKDKEGKGIQHSNKFASGHNILDEHDDRKRGKDGQKDVKKATPSKILTTATSSLGFSSLTSDDKKLRQDVSDGGAGNEEEDEHEKHLHLSQTSQDKDSKVDTTQSQVTVRSGRTRREAGSSSSDVRSTNQGKKQNQQREPKTERSGISTHQATKRGGHHHQRKDKKKTGTTRDNLNQKLSGEKEVLKRGSLQPSLSPSLLAEKTTRQKKRPEKKDCPLSADKKINCFAHDKDHWKTPPLWTGWYSISCCVKYGRLKSKVLLY